MVQKVWKKSKSKRCAAVGARTCCLRVSVPCCVPQRCRLGVLHARYRAAAPAAPFASQPPPTRASSRSPPTRSTTLRCRAPRVRGGERCRTRQGATCTHIGLRRRSPLTARVPLQVWSSPTSRPSGVGLVRARAAAAYTRRACETVRVTCALLCLCAPAPGRFIAPVYEQLAQAHADVKARQRTRLAWCTPRREVLC